jgi:hypothetical protein
MHILDLIMYIITIVILLYITDIFCELTGIPDGSIALIIYTIVYILVFIVGDNNWIDIFHSIGNVTFSIQL